MRPSGARGRRWSSSSTGAPYPGSPAAAPAAVLYASSRMPRRDRHILLALAMLSLAFAIAQSATGVSPDLLLAVPALLLLMPLLAGRYLGEDGLARLAGRRAAPRRRTPARLGVRRRAPRLLPRGGRLIAAALAERGPPAAVPARA